MSYQLKVKSKALAAEAVIIRHEERNFLAWARKCEGYAILADEANKSGVKISEALRKDGEKLKDRAIRARAAFEDLRGHRIHSVREEARATHLARAYLRGRLYRDIELTTRKKVPVAKVQGMIQRYGVLDVGRQALSLEDWLKNEHWTLGDAGVELVLVFTPAEGGEEAAA